MSNDVKTINLADHIDNARYAKQYYPRFTDSNIGVFFMFNGRSHRT